MPSGTIPRCRSSFRTVPHLAFQYRDEIERELGAELPPVGDTLPEDIEQRLSSMVADAADQLLGTKQAMAQAEQNAAAQQDPIIQNQIAETQIKAGDLERKKAVDQARIAIDTEKIQSKERIETAKIQQRAEEAQIEAEISRDRESTSATLKGIRLGVDIAKDAGDSNG